MKIRFVKQDLWVGLYWKTETEMAPIFSEVTTWYFCLIPMFPIIWKTRKLLV